MYMRYLKSKTPYLKFKIRYVMFQCLSNTNNETRETC